MPVTIEVITEEDIRALATGDLARERRRYIADFVERDPEAAEVYLNALQKHIGREENETPVNKDAIEARQAEIKGVGRRVLFGSLALIWVALLIAWLLELAALT